MEHKFAKMQALREQLLTIVTLADLLRESATAAGLRLSYARIRAAALAMDHILAEHQRCAMVEVPDLPFFRSTLANQVNVCETN